jgi:heptosyltransferase I
VETDDLSRREFQNILLINLSAAAEIVQAMPLLNKVRRRYPKARIDVLTSPSVAELLRHNPAIERVLEFSHDEGSRPWRLAPLVEAAKLIPQIREAGYELVLDLEGDLHSAIFARGSGATVRIGFDRPRGNPSRKLPETISAKARQHLWRGARHGSSLAYTHRVAAPLPTTHPVDRYLAVAHRLGLGDGAPDFSFPIPPEASTRIDALLDYYGIAKARLIAIAPGADWQTEQWRAHGFAEVARHVLQKGFAVCLIGMEQDRAACSEVAPLAPAAINLAGETTLSELAALIRKAVIRVTNDSAPMHFAVALDRPVVSIFGPTDPIWDGPYSRPKAVLRAELPCSPCYLRELSACAYGHACMAKVSAAAVIARVEAVLAKLPNRPVVPGQTSRQQPIRR